MDGGPGGPIGVPIRGVRGAGRPPGSTLHGWGPWGSHWGPHPGYCTAEATVASTLMSPRPCHPRDPYSMLRETYTARAQHPVPSGPATISDLTTPARPWNLEPGALPFLPLNTLTQSRSPGCRFLQRVPRGTPGARRFFKKKKLQIQASRPRLSKKQESFLKITCEIGAPATFLLKLANSLRHSKKTVSKRSSRACRLHFVIYLPPWTRIGHLHTKNHTHTCSPPRISGVLYLFRGIRHSSFLTFFVSYISSESQMLGRPGQVSLPPHTISASRTNHPKHPSSHRREHTTTNTQIGLPA